MSDIKLFDYEIKDKNKTNIYALFESFSLSLVPYLSLYYSDDEINNLIKYYKKDKIKRGFVYIDKTISDHGFYNLYISDNEFKNLYCFIIGFYDNETKELKKDIIKLNFKSVKNNIFKTMDYLTNNKNNKFNDDDYYYFTRAANWILKVFDLDEKNLFFSYFDISDNKYYDYLAVSEFISDLIISNCKKTHNYKKFNIVDSNSFKQIGERDKQKIKPIIDYINKNAKCVNIEDFNKLPIIQNNKFIIQNNKFNYQKIDNQKINNLINKLTVKQKNKNFTLPTYYFLTVLNNSFMLNWNCYILSTFMSIMGINEISKFINKLEFIKYLYDFELSENENINKIKNSLFYNIYNRDLKKISNILKSHFPDKYNFLGLSNTIIQPYILFNDSISILTEEIKIDKLNNLFCFTDIKDNLKLFFKLDKLKYNNDDLSNIINQNIKHSNDYFILAINNNSAQSLDQKDYKQTKERKDKYPINLKINNQDYNLHSYILFIPDHHYQYEKFNQKINSGDLLNLSSSINQLDLSNLGENVRNYIKDNENKKEYGFKYYYHMLIYQRI